MQQPPLIRYNLKDRGRKYRGQERNFNIQAICDSINGPVTQERIKTRAMLGYFGHNPRILAGMEPTESMVINGKYNEIEPAIVTTSLKAYPDGTIEHQTEFLDTVPGRKAARMFKSRVGGFSSAIDERKPEFFGFDYVLDPNYSTNRPYTLDSTSLTLDAVLDAVHEEEEAFWLHLLAEKDAKIEQLAYALDSAQTDNEQLLSALTKADKELPSDEMLMPVAVSLDSAQRIQRDIELFRSAKLPTLAEPEQKAAKAEADPFYSNYVRRMGY